MHNHYWYQEFIVNTLVGTYSYVASYYFHIGLSTAIYVAHIWLGSIYNASKPHSALVLAALPYTWL